MPRTGSGKRRALVTGASSGIGLAFAEALARDGHDLVVMARSAARLEALAEKLHAAHRVAVEAVAADLTKAAALHKVEAMVADDPHLELLVNNAGFGTVGRFVSLDPDREEEEIRLNVIALVRLTRAALPGMVRRKRGGVINVSSLAAFNPGPVNATYSATKAFVNSFTEALHEELRGSGVRVQALCPGFTHTEFQERAGIDKSRIPSFVWMSAEAVVEASLAGLRRGEVVCIPGVANRLTAGMTSLMPRRLVRRVLGIGSRRLLES